MAPHESRRKRFFIALLSAALLLALVPAVVSAGTSDFDDVPPTNVFYNDISWMADAGVTKGCSDTRFCPDDFVTREQMAAFMHRLAIGGSVDAGMLGGVSAADYVTHDEVGAGPIDADTLDGLDSTKFLRSNAKAVDADRLDGIDSSGFLRSNAKAVDADKLDGKNSTEFLPTSRGSRATGALSDNLPDADGAALIAELSSPGNGILIIGANVDVTATAGEDTVLCTLSVNGNPLSGVAMFTTVDDVNGPAEGICSTSGIAVVSSGDFLIALEVYRGGTAALYAGTLWAQWIPFDGSGGVPVLGAETFGPESTNSKPVPGR